MNKTYESNNVNVHKIYFSMYVCMAGCQLRVQILIMCNHQWNLVRK